MQKNMFRSKGMAENTKTIKIVLFCPFFSLKKSFNLFDSCSEIWICCQDSWNFLQSFWSWKAKSRNPLASRIYVRGLIWKHTVENFFTNATCEAMHLLKQAIWGLIRNALWRKIKLMQQVCPYIFSNRKFQDSFENTQ